MFKNMKLRYRILLGYAVPLVLFLIVAILVFVDVRELAESSEIARRTSVAEAQGSHIELQVSAALSATRAYLLTRDGKYLKIFDDGARNFTTG